MNSSLGREKNPAQQPIDLSGSWENELGSKMMIEVDRRGRVEGRYATSVGAGNPHEAFELTGFASGDLLSFTVDFGRYGSLSAWVGQHTTDEHGEVLQTMWLLARDVLDPAEPQRLWSATLTGANVFRRCE